MRNKRDCEKDRKTDRQRKVIQLDREEGIDRKTNEHILKQLETDRQTKREERLCVCTRDRRSSVCKRERERERER